MTAQLEDEVSFQGQTWTLAGISEGELIDPAQFSLKLSPAGSACWRGYRARFTVHEQTLRLSRLEVAFSPEQASPSTRPVIGGVTPVRLKPPLGGLRSVYGDLSLPLAYSGGILLGRELLHCGYTNMGFHPAWKYRELRELILHKGRVEQVYDRSQAFAELRRRLQNEHASQPKQLSENELNQFVANAFDRRY